MIDEGIYYLNYIHINVSMNNLIIKNSLENKLNSFKSTRLPVLTSIRKTIKNHCKSK